MGPFLSGFADELTKVADAATSTSKAIPKMPAVAGGRPNYSASGSFKPNQPAIQSPGSQKPLNLAQQVKQDSKKTMAGMQKTIAAGPGARMTSPPKPAGWEQDADKKIQAAGVKMRNQAQQAPGLPRRPPGMMPQTTFGVRG